MDTTAHRLQLQLLYNFRECGQDICRAREVRKAEQEKDSQDNSIDETGFNIVDFSDEACSVDAPETAESQKNSDNAYCEEGLKSAIAAGWKIGNSLDEAHRLISNNIRLASEKDPKLMLKWKSEIKAQQEKALACFLDHRSSNKDEHPTHPWLEDPADNTEAIMFEKVRISEPANQCLSDAEIIAKTLLNAKQQEAFCYACRAVHEEFNSTEQSQLRLVVAGAGGTGKPRVLHALKFLLEQLGRIHELRGGSYMAFAAANVGGITLHRLIGGRHTHPGVSHRIACNVEERKIHLS